MSYGLEVYDVNGKLILNSSSKLPRILGSFVVTTTTGSRVITSVEGKGINELFARSLVYRPPIDVVSTNRYDISNLVYTLGNTIYWEKFKLTGYANNLIVFGDIG